MVSLEELRQSSRIFTAFLTVCNAGTFTWPQELETDQFPRGDYRTIGGIPVLLHTIVNSYQIAATKVNFTVCKREHERSLKSKYLNMDWLEVHTHTVL